jgi:ubiquitin-like protein Pup
MADRQQAEKQTAKQETEEAEAVEAKDLSNEELDESVDDILAEIDNVLEVNALEFVQGFVQQGGE